jgi:hypothetical protein
MKYTLTLIAACIPLVALTGNSLWRMLRGDCVAGPDVSVNSTPSNPWLCNSGCAASAGELASGQRERLKADRHVTQQLVQADLLVATNAEFTKGSAESVNLNQAAGNWEFFKGVFPFAERLSKLPPPPPPPANLAQWPEQIDVRRAAVQQFTDLRPQYAGKLKQAEGLFHRLELQLADLDIQKQAAESLLRARECWKKDDYAGCLDELNKVHADQIQDPPAQIRVRELAVRLGNWAGYRVESKQVIAALGDEATTPPEELSDAKLAAQRQSLMAFCTRWSPGADISSADRDEVEKLASRRDELLTETDWRKLWKPRLEGLSKAVNLAELQQRMSTIVSSAKTAKRESLVEKVLNEAGKAATKWLTTTGFPRLPLPAWWEKLAARIIQEGVVNGGAKRVIGEFYLPDNGTMYRVWLWDSGNNRSTKPNGDTQVGAKAFDPPADPLGRPRYVLWYNDYHKFTERLSDRTTKEEWLAALKSLETMQKELDKYQLQWGAADEPDKSLKEKGWQFFPDRDAGPLPHKDLNDLCDQLIKLRQLLEQ